MTFINNVNAKRTDRPLFARFFIIKNFQLNKPNKIRHRFLVGWDSA